MDFFGIFIYLSETDEKFIIEYKNTSVIVALLLLLIATLIMKTGGVNIAGMKESI